MASTKPIRPYTSLEVSPAASSSRADSGSMVMLEFTASWKPGLETAAPPSARNRRHTSMPKMPRADRTMVAMLRPLMVLVRDVCMMVPFA